MEQCDQEPLPRDPWRSKNCSAYDQAAKSRIPFRASVAESVGQHCKPISWQHGKGQSHIIGRVRAGVWKGLCTTPVATNYLHLCHRAIQFAPCEQRAFNERLQAPYTELLETRTLHGPNATTPAFQTHIDNQIESWNAFHWFWIDHENYLRTTAHGAAVNVTYTRYESLLSNVGTIFPGMIGFMGFQPPASRVQCALEVSQCVSARLPTAARKCLGS